MLAEYRHLANGLADFLAAVDGREVALHDVRFQIQHAIGRIHAATRERNRRLIDVGGEDAHIEWLARRAQCLGDQDGE